MHNPGQKLNFALRILLESQAYSFRRTSRTAVMLGWAAQW